MGHKFFINSNSSTWNNVNDIGRKAVENVLPNWLTRSIPCTLNRIFCPWKKSPVLDFSLWQNAYSVRDKSCWITSCRSLLWKMSHAMCTELHTGQCITIQNIGNPKNWNLKHTIKNPQKRSYLWSSLAFQNHRINMIRWYYLNIRETVYVFRSLFISDCKMLKSFWRWGNSTRWSFHAGQTPRMSCSLQCIWCTSLI